MIGISSIKKLFGGLAKTREDLSRRIAEACGSGRVDEAGLEAIEEALLAADVGVAASGRVVERVRERARRRGSVEGEALRALVAEELAGSLADSRPEARAAARAASPDPAGGTRVTLVVGVNGGGKTTTVAKLAARARGQGRSVLVAAADTYRAAATEQLEIWAERAGAPLIRHAQGADPGAVVFDAARAALGRGSDALIIDTAGRLHTKSNLMQELQKIVRVVGREIPGAPHEVLLVMDATTGQNGLAQAREFTRVVPVTGLVLTKLDGTARGGVAIAIADELKIPIQYVGVGEGLDDLLEFEPNAFVISLLGSEQGAGPAAAP